MSITSVNPGKSLARQAAFFQKKKWAYGKTAGSLHPSTAVQAKLYLPNGHNLGKTHPPAGRESRRRQLQIGLPSNSLCWVWAEPTQVWFPSSHNKGAPSCVEMEATLPYMRETKVLESAI